jgi:hypothetical protein
MTMPPESVESRERWREALDAHLARRARIRALRLELATARAAGKVIRHANRLRRARHATTTEGSA